MFLLRNKKNYHRILLTSPMHENLVFMYIFQHQVNYVADNILNVCFFCCFFFFFFSEKIGLDSSCESSARQLKSYFLWKKKIECPLLQIYLALSELNINAS